MVPRQFVGDVDHWVLGIGDDDLLLPMDEVCGNELFPSGGNANNVILVWV